MQQREPPATINSYNAFSNQFFLHNEHIEHPLPLFPQRVCANPAGGPETTTSSSLASSIVIQASTVQPQATSLFLLPTSSQSHIVNSTVYSTAKISIMNTPLIEARDTNTPTYSPHYLHTESFLSPVIETSAQTSFPLSMTVTVTPSNVPVDNGTTDSGSRMGALYATITVCIVFAIVIIALAVIIIFQSRRKLGGMLRSSKNGSKGNHGESWCMHFNSNKSRIMYKTFSLKTDYQGSTYI